jgi:hypothetical protein
MNKHMLNDAARKLVELRDDLALLRLRLALRAFDPNQPRWPPANQMEANGDPLEFR